VNGTNKTARTGRVTVPTPILGVAGGKTGTTSGAGGTFTVKGAGVTSLSAAETAMISSIKAAKKRVYVNLSANASNALISAVVAAAQTPGMDVKAILDTSAGFDKTWLLQQQLESSNVDTDVHASQPTPGSLVVADSTYLSLVGGKVKSDTSSADAQAAAFKANMLQSAPPDPKAQLIGKGQLALLPMPQSTRKRIVELINAAKKTIDLSIYQLQDREVIEALKKAAANGVKVRAMLEPHTVGSSNYVPVAAELKAAGIDVTTTPPNFDSSHNVDHAKFMIIDGAELVFGTGNLVRSGLGGVTEAAYNNRDFWVEDGRPDSINEAQQLFDADWQRKSTSSIPFKNLIVTPDNADARELALIAGATNRLYYFNQELVDPATIQALIAQKVAHPNLDLRVLVGYQPGFGGKPPKNDAAIAQLTDKKIPAKYLRAFYLHGKGIIADNKLFLGSQNGSNGGLVINREVGEEFDDPLLAWLADQVAAIFKGDFENA
jgi:phosphatidylserine/phosphatidylglycerophosphate/cardiolipin synthase-like enzyme